ncbi:MAG: hypothetical protein Kow0062_01940 [Acidobacteriota bacterium]
MITDRPPRVRARREAFERSDRLRELPLPDDDRLVRAAREIERTLAAEDRAGLERACRTFCERAAAFFGVPAPPVRVLAARPLRRYRGGGRTELYGDYEFDSGLIRVFMRTAVHKKVTSFGTLLSTLCHEFCHHLDVHRFGFDDTPHTRGFYERTARLYHHARGEPYRAIAWVRAPGGTWRVDWARMRRRGG